MTMFSKLIDASAVNDKHKCINLPSPITGNLLPLDQFPCDAHKNRLFGEGVTLAPSGYQIYSPFNALVEELPKTCERIRLRTKSGIRLQIQFGVGTQKLMGEGFKTKVKERQAIRKGQVIVEFDLPKLKQKLDTTLCAITILNSEKITGIVANYHQVVAMEDPMMTLVV